MNAFDKALSRTRGKATKAQSERSTTSASCNKSGIEATSILNVGPTKVERSAKLCCYMQCNGRNGVSSGAAFSGADGERTAA